MIYLDNAATTCPCEAALEAMNEALTVTWGNPSAVHGLGLAAERLLRRAREQVAEAMGCDPRRVFFTSGGTEGDNFALLSTARRHGKRGKHIVTTALEHHAVLNPARDLEAQGYEVTYLTPDETGAVCKADLLAALEPDTILVSVMLVNNENGAVHDITSMAKLVHSKSRALFHTDAVQGFLKVPFRCSSLGADIVTVSAHKVGGPKGIGAVYLKEGVDLPPLLHGGGQELLGGRSMRSGTENVPGAAGFGAACANYYTNLRERQKTMAALNQRLLAGLAEIPGVTVIGPHQAPHIVSLSVPGLRSQGLIGALEQRRIYVSAGSACSRGHRSHVLEAMGLPAEVIDGAIRVSLGFETTQEDVDGFLMALPEAIGSLRQR